MDILALTINKQQNDVSINLLLITSIKYVSVPMMKQFVHFPRTDQNQFIVLICYMMVSGGGIYKSPFKIQSRKRSTKLILTQSVDQTKLNKPTRPSSTTMITPPKQQ